MKPKRRLMVGLVVVLALVFGLASVWAPDKPLAELQARWAEAPSQFIMVADTDPMA